MQNKSLKDRAIQWLETKKPRLEEIKNAHRAMEVRIRKAEYDRENAEPNKPIALIEGTTDTVDRNTLKPSEINTTSDFDPADADEAVQVLAEAYCEKGGEFDDLIQADSRANGGPESVSNQTDLSINQLGDPPTIQAVTLTPDQKQSVIADLKALLKSTPKGEGRNGRARRREIMAPVSETLH